MHAEQLAQTIAAAPNFAAIDNLARLVWRGVAESHIDDAAATRLQDAITARRTVLAAGRSKPTQKPLHGDPTPAKPTISPDSIARRRKQAASGNLPPEVAAHFTVGQQAALSVVAQEVRRSGRCAWPIEKVAAIAGVCRSTVKAAIRRAADLGLLSVIERRVSRWRNLPNLVTVACSKWRGWLGRFRSAGGGVKNVTCTDTSKFRPVETAPPCTVDSPHVLVLSSQKCYAVDVV